MLKMDTQDAHESFKRLLNAARTKLQRPDITHGEISTMLGVTPQNVTNWATRGVSREGALLAEQHLNVSSTFIRKGIAAYPKYEPTASEVKEDAPMYGSWPFRNVTPSQMRKLTLEELDYIEAVIQQKLATRLAKTTSSSAKSER